MSVQLEASDRLVGHEASAKITALRERVLTVQAILFVSTGLAATVAWIVLLGWLVYRAVFVLELV